MLPEQLAEGGSQDPQPPGITTLFERSRPHTPQPSPRRRSSPNSRFGHGECTGGRALVRSGRRGRAQPALRALGARSGRGNRAPRGARLIQVTPMRSARWLRIPCRFAMRTGVREAAILTQRRQVVSRSRPRKRLRGGSPSEKSGSEFGEPRGAMRVSSTRATSACKEADFVGRRAASRRRAKRAKGRSRSPSRRREPRTGTRNRPESG